ncbi:endonuclease/exonuclease/phosphatase family protein [Thalassovita taeanensis]|uniref:Endonuclease/Exonuclease/phosphatase family protein n=1 Tax=Thalassovita taeanensis TaxID=657014 RepID=A0A1H9CMZ8_9RHOB|nr:endonuclease/exonuclease/phosphatase family protein [Thalassovita taeanensis]SEQ02539.1 Endonuclease/Exonuclease/phosphatase family protein [Thalassovita taeanensis]
MRIATFNLQNLRLRGTHLDGARDGDMPRDQGPQAARLDKADRHLTAQVIRETQADVLALQEVFDQETLDHFHDNVLAPIGVNYPYRHCLPGNDGRGLDVAVLSRRPLDSVQSHASLTPADLGLTLPGAAPDLPVFRRDVLQVETRGLTLFICHFKAPYPDTPQVWATRHAEAQALHRLITRRFADPAHALWLVLGDLNEPARRSSSKSALAPLLGDFSVNLLDRLPSEDRWSWHNTHQQLYGHPDAILASPAVARRWPDAVPQVIRSGMSLEAHRNPGPHLAQTGHHRPHASDHAALVLDLPGL